MDTAQILAALRAQRDQIDQAIAALEALDGSTPTSAKPGRKQPSPPCRAHPRSAF